MIPDVNPVTPNMELLLTNTGRPTIMAYELYELLLLKYHTSSQIQSISDKKSVPKEEKSNEINKVLLEYAYRGNDLRYHREM